MGKMPEAQNFLIPPRMWPQARQKRNNTAAGRYQRSEVVLEVYWKHTSPKDGICRRFE